MDKLHTLEDFCRYLYHPGDPDMHRRYYYQLARLSKNRYRVPHYREIALPKRDGGVRILHAPDSHLKLIQRKILPLLSQGTISPFACAYRRGMGLVQNASPHVGQPLLLKVDLHDFFGSITFYQVFRAIDRALQASDTVGCHYLNSYDRSDREQKNYNSVLSFYFARFCTLDGKLPQGAPTSPMLSNLVFAPLDKRIEEFCQKRKILYTRYSDDLTFSGQFSPQSVISFVSDLLRQNGFSLNHSKTLVLGPGKRHMVTGAVVNQKLQADRNTRRFLRQELYYIQKFGPEDHFFHRLGRQVSPADLVCQLNSLLGRVSFVLQLDCENTEFIQYKKFLLRLLKEYHK